MAVLGRLDNESRRLQSLVQRVPVSTALYIQAQRHRLDLCEKYIAAASPEHILSLGYSITRINGRAVRSIDEVLPGDNVVTSVAGGEFESIIIDKKSI